MPLCCHRHVQLARNTETQELVAIKFIERGDRVNRCGGLLSY